MIYLKKLLNSTVLGAALGVLLVGYAVFAFDPPTQAPPGGNVPAPINTGTSNQTKAGGILSVFDLWVNSGLGVMGGATFGGNVGIGTLSPGEKLDVKGILRLSGSTSGYVGLAPLADAGSTTYILPNTDGTPGQVLATDGSAMLYWTSTVIDNDGDGAGYPTDCYDSNANAYSGQPEWFETHRGDGNFDYNCDGVVTKGG